MRRNIVEIYAKWWEEIFASCVSFTCVCVHAWRFALRTQSQVKTFMNAITFHYRYCVLHLFLTFRLVLTCSLFHCIQPSSSTTPYPYASHPVCLLLLVMQLDPCLLCIVPNFQRFVSPFFVVLPHPCPPRYTYLSYTIKFPTRLMCPLFYSHSLHCFPSSCLIPIVLFHTPFCLIQVEFCRCWMINAV